MIKIVNGNLLDAKEDIIGHQTNASGGFGSGIAGQIKVKYPVVYRDFIYWYTMFESDQLLGKCQIVKLPNESSKYVANLYGQLNYGSNKGVVYTNYDALKSALTFLKEYAVLNELSVALPVFLGCGLANGSWDTVYKMIEEIFEDYDVVLYKYNG